MNYGINSVADLSIDRLNDLIDRGMEIKNITVLGDFPTTVNVEEYKQIYSNLLELTDGIKPEWSKTKKFILLYKRISKNIEYDYIAANPKEEDAEQQEYSERESENCRNLKNGLLLGKCVCAGYAEILRNACLLKGVPAILFRGYAGGGYHAWNQVEINDGEWLEVDPTWDHNSGTEYIGTNKQKFWKEHRRKADSYTAIIYSEENNVFDFDLTEFINNEFGINIKRYSIKEEKEFIELLDKRDVQALDISSELNKLIKKVQSRIKREEKFERRTGYKIEYLKMLGIEESQIESWTNLPFWKIKEVKKQIEYKKIQQELEKDFERECDYEKEYLRFLGLEDEEIEEFQKKYDEKTGNVIDRKKRIEERIAQKKANNIEEKVITLTVEEKKILKEKCKNLHPDTVTVLIKEVERGVILLEEAYLIIDYRNNINNIEDDEKMAAADAIMTKIIERQARSYDDEFERECGYTISELLSLGFSKQEIDQMTAKLDLQTGQRIDRKQVVEDAIKDKEKNKKVTPKSIGECSIQCTSENLKKAKEIISNTIKEKAIGREKI